MFLVNLFTHIFGKSFNYVLGQYFTYVLGQYFTYVLGKYFTYVLGKYFTYVLGKSFYSSLPQLILDRIFRLVYSDMYSINPLVSSANKSAQIAKISILKFEGIIKIFPWASRLWVCRWNEPMSRKTTKKEFRQERVISI